MYLCAYVCLHVCPMSIAMFGCGTVLSHLVPARVARLAACSLMPPTAPVVLRSGTLIAHVNDINLLAATAAALSTSGSSRSSSTALAAHEKALSVARSMGFTGSLGMIAAQLRSAGLPSLSRRVRKGARVRGAEAHPDTMLAGDIARELDGRTLQGAAAPPLAVFLCATTGG